MTEHVEKLLKKETPSVKYCFILFSVVHGLILACFQIIID